MPWLCNTNIDEFITLVSCLRIRENTDCEFSGWCVPHYAGWWQLWQDTPPLASWKQQISAAAIKTWTDNTTERKPETGTIRQSETVLVLSAVQRLHCLTAQTTMPRAEITGNASLSERGRNRGRRWESVMASSLFTYRLIEKKIPLCPLYKNLLFTYRFHPERFFSTSEICLRKM